MKNKPRHYNILKRASKNRRNRTLHAEKQKKRVKDYYFLIRFDDGGKEDLGFVRSLTQGQPPPLSQAPPSLLPFWFIHFNVPTIYLNPYRIALDQTKPNNVYLKFTIYKLNRIKLNSSIIYLGLKYYFKILLYIFEFILDY